VGRPTTTGKRHKVTVLIATYNHGGFIETAGESALEQSPVAGDVQIVAVDDGSTGDTSERLRRHGSAIDYASCAPCARSSISCSMRSW
jgi:glycosyltransferase involved in cell wall biosynthesis